VKRSKAGVAAAGIFSLMVQSGYSWAGAGFAAGQSLDARAALSEALAGIAASNAASPSAFFAEGAPVRDVEWTAIDGTDKVYSADWLNCGKGLGYCMGADSGDAQPVHEVVIHSFQMSKTMVTVEQYAACVSAGQCGAPATSAYCNWGIAGRERHPVNCVTWAQANQFAKFKSSQSGFQGARLPSESEWEYAAKDEGQPTIYPWGATDPACGLAVMYGDGGYGCGNDSTMPVCSMSAGNTAQGLCDMAGNLSEWVEDVYQSSYSGAPADGKAFEGAGTSRVTRGGSFKNGVASALRSDARGSDDPIHSYVLVGFRLARPAP
jgi:sulfatase modifying factor 1